MLQNVGLVGKLFSLVSLIVGHKRLSNFLQESDEASGDLMESPDDVSSGVSETSEEEQSSGAEQSFHEVCYRKSFY